MINQPNFVFSNRTRRNVNFMQPEYRNLRVKYFTETENPCFLCRRFIWNFLRVENEHLSRLKGVVDHSEEELREYDEDTESEQTDES